MQETRSISIKKRGIIMEQLAFEIKERCLSEKNKNLRKNGEIPGIIYGEFLKESIPVKMEKSNLLRLLKSNSKGSILKLNLKDTTRNCVVKQVQKDNTTGEILHVDFQYVKENEVIKMKIPVSYEGLNQLTSRKLVLQTYLSELEMQGDVEKIPKFIRVDVSNMNFDDKLSAGDIKLPEEIRLITEPDTLIAVVSQ